MQLLVQLQLYLVLTLVLRTIRGEIRPVMSLYDCRQIGSYPTTLPLMRAAKEREADQPRCTYPADEIRPRTDPP